MPLETRFTHTADGTRIAYHVRGGGPVLVYAWGFSADPEMKLGIAGRIVEGRTIVTFDPRGTGRSDREAIELSVDAAIDDLAAVVDCFEGPVDLLGTLSLGTAMTCGYAVRHPERVRRVVQLSPAVQGARSARSPVRESIIAMARSNWEVTSKAAENWSRAVDFAEELKARPHELVDAEAAARYYELTFTLDATEFVRVLPVPLLVVHGTEDLLMPVEQGEHVASLAPDGRFVPIEGMMTWPARPAEYAACKAAIQPFLDEGLTAARASAGPSTGGFQTLLFTDIESSTELTQRLGDAAAQSLLHEHDRAVRAALAEHGGREVKHTGDGIMAAFPSAVGAVAAALAVQRALEDGAVRVRLGLNAGEPIAEGGDLFGTAVQLAARISDHAKPGQVLVSRVVADLCAGKGWRFRSLGNAALRGFSKPVELFEVVP